MNSLPLGGMSLDIFLSEYWQKKSLLVRQAFSNVHSPISPDQLAGLACENGIESRLILQQKNNSQWDLKHGPFNEEVFSELPNSHWTLLVQAVNHWVPDAARLLERFNFIPSWRIDDLMISYASDGGGVGPHYDNYDVFLLQTRGKRKWEVGAIFSEESSLRTDTPVAILTEFEALETWVLEPGDMLYVPPGTGHNGIAEGDDCMTCSIGFRAPSHRDILRDYTDYIAEKLTEEVRYKDTDLLPQSNPGEITTQALNKIQQILQTYLTDEKSINDWFGRYITTPKYHQAEIIEVEPDALDLQLKELKSHFESGELLFRNETSRFAFEVENNKHILFVDGQCLIEHDFINSNLNELISILCKKIEFTIKDIPQDEQSLSLLLSLLQRGALYLSDPQKNDKQERPTRSNK